MSAQGQMKEVGHCPPLSEGSTVWFAEQGRFTSPGLYVHDGVTNHLVVRWADLSIAMSDPDVSEDQSHTKRRWWSVIVRNR